MSFTRIPPGGNAVGLLRLLQPPREDLRTEFPRRGGFDPGQVHYTGSGTTALLVALRAMRRAYPGKSGVLLPAWCCPSVAQAVLAAGLRPETADLDPETLAYAPGTSAGPDTLAVLLVHFFGLRPPRPAGTAPFLLRDCAQDMDFKNTGEADTVFFYSFGRGKSLNTGQGGALCFPGLPAESPLAEDCARQIEALPAASRALPRALMLEALSHPLPFGLLSRMPFLGIGTTVWEPLHPTRPHPGFFRLAAACLEAFESRRGAYAALARRYAETLGNIPGLHLPFRPAGESFPFRFPLLVADPEMRERIHRRLNDLFGGVTRQYPALLADLPGAPADFPRGRFPGCERIAREILTLPVTAWLLGKEEAFLRELRAACEG